MPSSKPLTPGPDLSHPASNLKVGDPEDIQTLLKLTPVTLPNVSTVQSLAENYPNDKRWTTFRSDPRYIYVMNWMYQCRGYLKLISEHFDADLFEIELFELVYPPPLDELALLVNKTKLALLAKIHGKKIASLASFEPLFRIYFGNNTPLGGKDVGDEDELDVDHSEFPRFDDLYIDEKIDILYMMMLEVSMYSDFRDFMDKNNLTPDQLRTTQIFSHPVKKNGHSEDYFLACDGTALYRLTVTFPELNVPKRRKLAPQWPDEEYGPEKFDSESIEYELIFRDIYGLNDYVATLLPNKKSKKNKAILDVIQLPAFVANVFSYEIRKRKILSHRRKDLEMARLLATRKRSLRLEAKEKQKSLEEQERKLKEMEELQYAASRRRSQRARLQMQTKMKMDYTAGLSREERFKLRLQKAEESVHGSEVSSPVLTEMETTVELNDERQATLELNDVVLVELAARSPVPTPSPSFAPSVPSIQPAFAASSPSATPVTSATFGSLDQGVPPSYQSDQPINNVQKSTSGYPQIYNSPQNQITAQASIPQTEKSDFPIGQASSTTQVPPSIQPQTMPIPLSMDASRNISLTEGLTQHAQGSDIAMKLSISELPGHSDPKIP